MTIPFGDSRGSIQHEGIERTFFMHIPPNCDPAIAAPLVFVLHGATGHGRRVAQVSKMSEVADKYGFIACYPDGVKGFWNDGRDKQNDIDDVGFVRALIEHLEQKIIIDSSKIFASGISNGAMMCLRLACELSDKISAIAPVAGSMPEEVALICVPEFPVSVVMFHGTEDTYLPYEGGDLKGRIPGSVLSAQRTAETWAELNKCGLSPKTTIFPMRDPTDGTQVQRDVYGKSPHGADVVLYTIYGGGHTWPSGKNSSLLNLGKTSREIKASDVIWQFFDRHSRK